MVGYRHALNMHVSKACSKAFRSLYHIKQVRKYLTEDSKKILVHAFITSHTDHCNSLLYGIPKYQMNRLQKVINAAARVVCLVPKFDHITPTLMRLGYLLNIMSFLKLYCWFIKLCMVSLPNILVTC